ncbi:acyl-CoA dehydrogenase family protein [Nocardia donostiensis]|uniref:Acyl-CoA dehydrogenase n=1 Tax=Nocardia donostiensis TaxID=1538463 RepID=A0A1W0B127_9NOCA|nr:acyl-CoA dehydrogenase family protein [Nocardia donostiensis]ONM46751.1 acyl-CoA dehydrogenase [Nocardia donostiensis]OQS16225.1 acyl-CoA dehydrogenase [Nocardia donostiensis]OQS19629.1 acyl-CoA dehydrogenase [Nocardia donostiensis]
MDFELSDTQRPVVDALDTLLARHAGVERCRKLASGEGYDHALERELRVGGFFDSFTEESVGPLGATLAVERIGAHLGTISATAHLLVLPALGIDSLEGAVALVLDGEDLPVRFAAEAATVLTAGADRCALSHSAQAASAALPSAYGYSLGRVVAEAGEDLAPGTAATMINWWRIGVSAEAIGMMHKALDIAVQYAKDRRTFGRAIGSFQALQHRAAELTILLEGARWLTYEAAFHGAPEEAAATAAAHTMAALHTVTRETHQLLGAIGLTREHDLHLYTLRLQALRTELGGLRHHRRALVAARWGGDVS